MRLIFAGLVSLFAFVSTAQAAASDGYTGRCLLVIDKVIYMRGEACAIQTEDDGSTRIANGDVDNKYFADVRIVDGSKSAQGQASWNGTEAASHAHDDLGTLVRNDGREPSYCFHTPWDGPLKPDHYVLLCSMFPPEVIAAQNKPPAPAPSGFCINFQRFMVLANGNPRDLDNLLMAMATVDVKHEAICPDFQADYSKLLGKVSGTPRYVEKTDAIRAAIARQESRK